MKCRKCGEEQFKVHDVSDLYLDTYSDMMKARGDDGEFTAMQKTTITGDDFGYVKVEKTTTTQMGWVCPMCGRVFAPWIRECDSHGAGYAPPSDPCKWTISQCVNVDGTITQQLTCSHGAVYTQTINGYIISSYDTNEKPIK